MKLYDAIVSLNGCVVADTKVRGRVDAQDEEHGPADGDELVVVVLDENRKPLMLKGKLEAI